MSRLSIDMKNPAFISASIKFAVENVKLIVLVLFNPLSMLKGLVGLQQFISFRIQRRQ
jgi:hypothetical protein